MDRNAPVAQLDRALPSEAGPARQLVPLKLRLLHRPARHFRVSGTLGPRLAALALANGGAIYPTTILPGIVVQRSSRSLGVGWPRYL
jgi:hypothetical protein